VSFVGINLGFFLGSAGLPGFGTGSPEETMLMLLFALLLTFWLLGIASSYTLGGFIHVLLVLAIAAVLVRIIQGREPL
jgi:hypothetical protein